MLTDSNKLQHTLSIVHANYVIPVCITSHSFSCFYALALASYTLQRHEHFIVLNDLGEEGELNVSGQVIVLLEDVKIEPVVDRYILRTNYFVEYLHFDNNGRLDGFLNQKNDMYILNNKYDACKEICDKLKKVKDK